MAVTMLVFGAVAFLVGRWWAIALPAVGLAVFYVGLNLEWWGHGVGEGWQVAMAILMAVGVVGALLGPAARAFVRAS